MIEPRNLETKEVWEDEFFRSLLEEHAIVGRAAKAAGVSIEVIERRRRESIRFAAMLDRAEGMIDEALEFESLRRALEPNERPIFQRGQLIGVVKDWDTRHLEWVLERRMPHKYHLPSRVELEHGETDVTFKLALGDTEPASAESIAELEEG